MRWRVKCSKSFILVMKLIAISRVTREGNSQRHRIPHSYRLKCPNTTHRKTINIPGRSLVRLWKAKQKKMQAINASDQCECEPKCTREWKVTGQTSSAADAVPLACCNINFAMRAQSDRQSEILIKKTETSMNFRS